MAVTICWSAKGGSGTTVVAACLALIDSSPTLLVDLAGDLPAVLGLPEPAGQGLADWLDSDAPPEALADLEVHVDASTGLVPRGAARVDRRSPRWADLAAALRGDGRRVVVDAGVGAPPAPFAAGRELLVTRACYLALRRVATMATRPDGVVLVREPGRGLRARDVEQAVGAPVVATLGIDPAIARAVDAGLLGVRLPRSVQSLRGAA